jgi:hypothetical protein
MEDADTTHDVKGEYIKASNMTQLHESDNKVALQAMCFHNIRNVFGKVCFGANEHGIHQLLHAHEMSGLLLLLTIRLHCHLGWDKNHTGDIMANSFLCNSHFLLLFLGLFLSGFTSPSRLMYLFQASSLLSFFVAFTWGRITRRCGSTLSTFQQSSTYHSWIPRVPISLATTEKEELFHPRVAVWQAPGGRLPQSLISFCHHSNTECYW